MRLREGPPGPGSAVLPHPGGTEVWPRSTPRCSGATTLILLACPSSISSWGFGAVPSLDSAPRAAIHSVALGPSHSSLNEWGGYGP